MSGVLPLVAAWAVWCLLDRRRPPQRVIDLARPTPVGLAAPPRPVVRQSSTPSDRPDPSGRGSRRRVLPVVAPPDLAASVDLLAVAVSAGYSLHEAVKAAGTEGTGPVAAALSRVATDFDRGVPMADGLARLRQDLGPSAASLSTTLSVAAASGTPIGPTLQRLADSERRRVRRTAEQQARRLPVLLLAPLVGLVLPAFVVLTIVPAALSSVRPAARPSLEAPSPRFPSAVPSSRHSSYRQPSPISAAARRP